MKRSAPVGQETKVEDTSVLKRLKPDDPDGSWECNFCTNVNWPKRTTCNKRGCHMPRDCGEVEHPEGSWACTACQNINWPKRTNCNKCKLGRPGAGPQAGGFGGAPNAAVMAGLQDAQPGSWACPQCQNINWPMRTSCNKKSCGAAKPANASLMGSTDPMAAYYGGMAQGMQGGMPGGMGPDFYGHAMGAMGQGGMGGLLGNPYMMGSMAGMAGMGGQGASADPQGSWVCTQCTNVNWPKRTTCNRTGCGAPKPVGAVGPNGQPAAGAGGAAPADPEGSWACPTCANVNWPQRTVCNKRECDTAKPM